MCAATREMVRQRILQLLVGVAFLGVHCGRPANGQVVTVSVEGGAVAMAGSPATLRCDASGFTGSLSYSWYFGGMVVFGAASSTYTIFQVHVVHAGVYACAVSGDGGSIVVNTTLEIQIPTPTIEFNLLPYRPTQYTGVNMTLQCKVRIPGSQLSDVSAEISLQGPSILGAGERISIGDVVEVTLGDLYNREVFFTALSREADAGLYTCNASVVPISPSSLVRNGLASNSHNLIIADPSVNLVISSPSPLRILDIAPFNSFNLTCTATTLVTSITEPITLRKSINWFQILESGPLRNITTGNVIGGVGHVVTSGGLGEATSTSVVTVTGNQAGVFTYGCEAVLDVAPASDVINNSVLTNITIHGGQPPKVPTNIAVTNITHSSVVIKWVVPFIQYTPEKYLIEYNTSTGSGESAPVLGNENITLTNQSYSKQLVFLDPFTGYRFRIKAVQTDSAQRESLSQYATFTTAESKSSPPEMLQYTELNQTTFYFTWSEPASHNGILISYIFLCEPLLDGVPTVPMQLLPISVTNTSVSGLHNGVMYECAVRARNGAGDSDPGSVVFTTIETEPTGPPLNFTARSLPGGRRVSFSWDPPAIVLRNGILTGYLLSCTRLPEVIGFAAEVTTALVTGLAPRTAYSCFLTAENGAGLGPSTVVNFTTLEDSVLFQLRWELHESCTSWVSEARDEKIEDVIAAIVDGVSTSCEPDTCGLSGEYITDSVFQCYADSADRVTYRALLHGTPESTSAELLAQLEEWVASSVSILFDSQRSNIDAGCAVRISSTDEAECVLPPDGFSILYISIIGSVAGVMVALIVVVLVILVALVVKTKKKRKRLYTINIKREPSECPSTARCEAHPLPPLPISQLADNPLYQQVSHEYEDISKYVVMASAVNPYVIDEGSPHNEAESDMTSDNPAHKLEPIFPFDQDHVTSDDAPCQGVESSLNTSSDKPDTTTYDQANCEKRSHVTFNVHNPSLGSDHMISGDTIFEETPQRSSGMYDHPFNDGPASSKNSGTTVFASAVSNAPPAVDLKSHPSIESENHQYINTSTCDEVFEMSGVYTS